MIRTQLFGDVITIITGDRKSGWARIRHKDGREENTSIFWSLYQDTEGEIDYVLGHVPDYDGP